MKKYSFLVITFLLLIIIVSPIFVSQLQSAQASTGSTMALEYIKEVLDKYHTSFDVYTDSSAAGNHFVLPAKMENDVQIDLNCPLIHIKEQPA